MNFKQKSLLYLLKRTGRISRIRLAKMMFLISREMKSYEFVPYRFGPFSFEMYHDLSKLETNGFLSLSKDQAAPGPRAAPPPPNVETILIDRISRRFTDSTDMELLDFIYENFPEYTIFSEYDRKQDYRPNSTGIVTIGYEGKTVDSFFYELLQNEVNVLVDVRKNPFSMKFGFSKKRLHDTSEKLGIDYLHLPDLGIVTSKRKNLNTLEDYQELFADYQKHLHEKSTSIDSIKEVGEKKKAALMCFEKDVRYCHRGVIAYALRSEGMEVIDL